MVEKIEIKFGTSFNKNDNEVATEILNAFKWNWQIPDDKIKVKVEDGWVTLEGELNWNYQREVAKKSVENLIGIKGVSNDLKIKTESQDTLEKAATERGLKRNWSINNEDIHVNVSGNNVILSGMVDSIYQKEEAGRIAWNAPGVYSVNNKLAIEYEGWLD